MKITKKIELDEMTHNYIRILAGATIEMASPDWDGDKSDTHIMMHITLDEDVDVCMADNELKGTIIKEFKSEKY